MTWEQFWGLVFALLTAFATIVIAVATMRAANAAKESAEIARGATEEARRASEHLLRVSQAQFVEDFLREYAEKEMVDALNEVWG